LAFKAKNNLCVLCAFARGIMRGDQLARQWRIIRAIEASPTGLTVAEIAKREETGIRTIYRDLEALQVAGFPLYNEKVENANRWHSSTPSNLKFLPPSP
jgi:predicted DNA-binding transcriptional regulator YafY